MFLRCLKPLGTLNGINHMARWIQELIKVITSFWFVVVTVALLGAVTAICLYRLRFGGGLSATSADWSAFGSYVGGVLGPLVSFLTLIAVIRTVYLQRELLDNQSSEFSKMEKHQEQAATSQAEQLALAKEELERTRAQMYLSTQLQFLETLRDHYRREADGLADVVMQLMKASNFSAATQVAAEEPIKKKQVAEQKIADLVGLSLQLSVLEYSSVESIKKECAPKILKIMYGDSILEKPKGDGKAE